MPSGLKNEPSTDFSKPDNEEAFEKAVAKVKSELGKEYDLIIGGKRAKTDKWIESIDPSAGFVAGIRSDAVMGLSEAITSAALCQTNE